MTSQAPQKVTAAEIKTGDVVVHPKEHIAYGVSKRVDGTITLNPVQHRYGPSYTYQIPAVFDLVGYTLLKKSILDRTAYAKKYAREENLFLLKRLEDKALNSDGGVLHVDDIRKEIDRLLSNSINGGEEQ